MRPWAPVVSDHSSVGPSKYLRRVVGLPHVGLERVLLEVVVRRADVGVAQDLAHQHERGAVVALGVVAVHHDVHAVLVLQVEERLLAVADHQHDVVDAGGPQLLYLALDEHLPADAEQALRPLVRYRREAGGHPRGEYHRVVHRVRPERRHAGGREAPPVHEAHRGALAVRRVHGGEPQPRRLGDVPLRGPGPVREGLDHLELVEGQIHPHPPFMFGFKLYFMNTNMESADQIAGG